MMGRGDGVTFLIDFSELAGGNKKIGPELLRDRFSSSDESEL